MKNKRVRILLWITGWALLLIGVVVVIFSTNQWIKNQPCKKLTVTITRDNDDWFVLEDELKQLFYDQGDSIINQPLKDIHVDKMEALLNNHVAIEKAQVYASLDGKVYIEAVQRKPIVRIINRVNDSYYIDDKGTLMPLSNKYTSRVLVANGEIMESYGGFNQYSISDLEKYESIRLKARIDDIYHIAKYVSSDSLWRAQIEQIYVNEQGDLELIPRVGDHRIVFGDATDIQDKFSKLEIFYREGLNTTGWWNKYSVVNLKYKNQVVCTKRA